MNWIRLAAAAGGLVAATGASAQNTGIVLTDGTATYRIGGVGGTIATSNTATTAPSMDLFLTGGGSDNLFNDWWWFRVGGDNREFNIANATSQTPMGSNGVSYGYDIGGGLIGSLSYSLTQPAAGSARIDQRWRIANPTSSTVFLSLFHYVDFDLSGSTQNTASLTTANERMSVQNPTTGTTADWWGFGAGAYQVIDFPNLRTLLTNSSIDDMNNTGLPFAVDDYTGAYQWRFEIAPGGSVQLLSSYGVDTSAIPAPGAIVLLGLAGLGGLRRRR